MSRASASSLGSGASKLLLAAAATSSALLLFAALSVGLGLLGGPETVRVAGRSVTPRGDLIGFEADTVALFEGSAPGVVHVSTSSEELRWFESLGRERSWAEGEGSGFVWDAAGHVVTNAHVVEGARTTVVTCSDGARYQAQLVGVSDALDLAVLRVVAPPGALRPLPIGSSEELRVGQLVFAIGSPFGLDLTLSVGLVAGLERTVRDDRGRLLSGMVQTDAGIHPGSSGGPLLDSAGRVVGVATAVVETGLGSGGIGFGIPIDVVARAVPRMVDGGSMGQATIGLLVGTAELSEMLGLEAGLPIGRVLPGSPAERAGLRGLEVADDGTVAADVLLELGGQALRSNADLLMALMEYAPGDLIPARVQRGERLIEVELEAIAAGDLEAR